MALEKRSLTYNTVFATIDRGFAFISGFFLLPFIIVKIGIETYGIWVILISVSNYFMLAQFGASSSFRKFLAEFIALQRDEKITRFFCTSFYLLACISLLVIIAGFVTAPYIMCYLTKGSMAGTEAHLLTWFLVISCIGLTNEVFVALPQSHQRFDITSITSASGRIIYIISVIVFLFAGYGIKGLLLSMFLSNAATCIANIAVCFRTSRVISLSPRYIDMQSLKLMYNFGIKVQISYFAAWVAFNFDKLLIAKVLGLQYTAYYDIVSRLVVLLREFPYLFFGVLLPRFSELDAVKKTSELMKSYMTGTRFMFAVCFTGITVLFPTGKLILDLWLRGAVDPMSVYVFNVLLIGSMFQLTTGVPSTLLKSIGKPGKEAIANMILAIVNISLSSVLLYFFGFRGIVWGTSLGLIIGGLILFVLTNKTIGVSSFNFFGHAALLPLVMTAIMTAAGIIAVQFYQSMHVPVSKLLSDSIYVALYFVSVLAVSAVLFIKTGFIPVPSFLQGTVK